MSETEKNPSKPVTMDRRTVLRKGLLFTGVLLTAEVSSALGATQYGVGSRTELREGIKDFFGIGRERSSSEPYNSVPENAGSLHVLRHTEGPKTAEVYVGVDGPVDQITITDTSRKDPRTGTAYTYTVNVDTQRNEATTRIPVTSNTGNTGTLETVHTNVAGRSGSPRLRSAQIIDQHGYAARIEKDAPPVIQAQRDLAVALDLGAKAKKASNTMKQNVADAPTTRVENLPDGGVKLVRTFTHRNLPGGKVTHEIPMSPGTHDTTGLALELVSNLTQVPDYKKLNPKNLEVFSKAAINTMLWEAQMSVAPPPSGTSVLGNTVNLDRVKVMAPELKGRSANDLGRDVPRALENALNGLKAGATLGAKADETWSTPGQTNTSRPKSNANDRMKWRDMRGPSGW